MFRNTKATPLADSKILYGNIKSPKFQFLVNSNQTKDLEITALDEFAYKQLLNKFRLNHKISNELHSEYIFFENGKVSQRKINYDDKIGLMDCVKFGLDAFDKYCRESKLTFVDVDIEIDNLSAGTLRFEVIKIN
jgi:hypothetical protein